MSEVGHNSGINSETAARLKQYVERVERLTEEKDGIAEDIRDVYSEAKSAGFNTKIIRKQVARRKMDAQKRIEEDELLELYEGVFA